MSKRTRNETTVVAPHSEIVIGHPSGQNMTVDDIARGLRLLEHEATRSGQSFLAHLIGVAAREAVGEEE